MNSPLRKKSKKQNQPKGAAAKPSTKTSTKKAPAPAATQEPPAAKPKAAPAAPKKLPPLKYRGYVGGAINVGPCEHMKPVVYGKLNSMLSMVQKVPGAKDTRILRFNSPDESPICNPSQMPKDHVEVQQYYDFPVETKAWVGRTIKAGKTRKLDFSFLMASNVPIELLVKAVGVDLIDLDIVLDYKDCQAIQSEARIHYTCIQNKFNEASMTNFLYKRFKAIQKMEFARDSSSLLGQREAAGKQFPMIVVKREYPYNGIWEQRKDGDYTDSRYKMAFQLQYAVEHTEIVEMASKIYKRSGWINRDFGQHATSIRAPEKDKSTDETTLLRYHQALTSHQAVMLSSGLTCFSDITNPDYEVEVEYWKKTTRSSSDVPTPPKKVSLRDIVHSITVPGATKPIQVFQGLCRKANGQGYEVGFAATSPHAKTLARHVSEHPCGWFRGYMTHKGYKKDMIAKLLKGSFTTESVLAAQNSTWDKKTGMVTSSHLSDEDLHFRQVQDSWVDMSLGKSGDETEVDATVEAGDIMAFNWEDGASVTSINTSNSGLPGAEETAFTGDVDVGEVSEVEELSSGEESAEHEEEEREFEDAKDDVSEEESESDEDESFDSYDLSEKEDAQFSDGDIEYTGDGSGADDDSYFSYDEDEVADLEDTATGDLEDILPEGYVYEDSGAMDVRNFPPLTPELKERLVALSANGTLPYSTVPLLEQFQALVAAETELKQRKFALLEEDEADPSVVAKTLELDQLIGDNQLAIAETNQQLQIAFRTPHKADDAVETSSPQPVKKPGTEDATKGDPPDLSSAMEVDPGANPSEVSGLGGKGG